MDGEIVVERRRQWTPEDKAALMAGVFIPFAAGVLPGGGGAKIEIGSSSASSARV